MAIVQDMELASIDGTIRPGSINQLAIRLKQEEKSVHSTRTSDIDDVPEMFPDMGKCSKGQLRSLFKVKEACTEHLRSMVGRL